MSERTSVMADRPRVVLATRNVKKCVEMQRILAETGVSVDVVTLDQVAPDAPDVAETELTFAGNALLKARAAATATGLVAVADDSGLCVDALNGMPGVLSARWAGSARDDLANLRLLLEQIADVPEPYRGAQFRCVLVAVSPDGREIVADGVMSGRIVEAPAGENGFGYDPIFQPDGHDQTSAQLTPAEKDAISHRGAAIRALAPQLAAMLGA